MKIYGDIQSGNCYKIKLLASLLDIEHEWVHVDILKDETHTTEFLGKNPNAKIITSDFSRVSPKEILNTNLFDFEEAQTSAGWQKELENEHTPETEEYGISSFVFRNKKPFQFTLKWFYLH